MKDLEAMYQDYNIFECFDMYLTQKTGEIIGPRVADRNVLEMGCSNGLMTDILVSYAKSLIIIEGVKHFTDEVSNRYKDRIKVCNCLFEEFMPDTQYDAIVLTNVLHNVNDPIALLKKVRNWLSSSGSLYITVPNVLSLHRQLGVKMGLIKDVFDNSERNIQFDQSGRYTKEILIKQLESCDYMINECFGFLLKPFSHEQMKALNPSNELIDALFELGKEYEDIASNIFLEAVPSG